MHKISNFKFQISNSKLVWFQLGILLILSGFILWPTLMPGYFFHHDDLQVMRVFEMRKCFDTGQIPCRWVPDMGYGNGYPLFNYYSVLPYYIGGVASYLFGFVGAAKVMFFIPLLIGGFGMYLLVRKLYGEWPAFLAAILYQFAPYRALDGYVRGAIAESFALAIIPFVFYFFFRLSQKISKGNLLGASLSLGFFLMCHNIMTMFFVPFLTIWLILLLVKEKFTNWRRLLITVFLGVGVASFFIIPVFGETNLVRTDTLLEGGSDFRAHFVTIPQLFIDRMWGYGASVFGPNDTISFQVGWPHWWLVIAAALMLLWVLKHKIFRIVKIDNLIPGLLIVGFGLSLFFMHNKSAFIWEAIKPLQFAQFPWRFLSISIFTSSILGGYFIFKLPKKSQLLIACALSLLTFFLNWQFFVPKDFYPWIDDKTKLSDPLWEIQQKAGLLDYLPKSAYYEPQGRAPYYPEIRQGEATTAGYTVASDTFHFDAEVKTNSRLEIPILEYPVWKVFVDGKEYPHSDQNHWGRLQIDLPPGNYQISGKLYNTPIRIIANLITLLSLVILGLLIFWPKFRKAILG